MVDRLLEIQNYEIKCLYTLFECENLSIKDIAKSQHTLKTRNIIRTPSVKVGPVNPNTIITYGDAIWYHVLTWFEATQVTPFRDAEVYIRTNVLIKKHETGIEYSTMPVEIGNS